LGCALAVAAGVAAKVPKYGVGDWRAQLTAPDRARLRSWRDSWLKALANARTLGAANQIASERPLLDPDAAIGFAAPPSGAYRCRTLKVGSQGQAGPGFVAYPWMDCQIDGDHLAKRTNGSQRAVGDLHRDEAGRLIFVGAMALGDEKAAFAYGRDSERNMVGIVEQIAPLRWRLVVPQPRWESLLDVTEIVPVS
jgi:hypothetical protein